MGALEDLVWLGFSGFLVTSIFFSFKSFLKRKAKIKKYYEFSWRSSFKLKPKDLLGERAETDKGFNVYYYARGTINDAILKNISSNRNILITGDPLAGKTRSIYQILTNSDESYDIILPKLVDIDTEDFLIPKRFGKWIGVKGIVIFDDIDKFLRVQTFRNAFLKFALDKSIILLATCQSRNKFEQAKAVLTKFPFTFHEDEIINIPKLSELEKKELLRETREANIQTNTTQYDGNIGSYFLPLEEMKKRFKISSPEERTILEAIKRLYLAGIYQGREIFKIERIKFVCKCEGLEEAAYKWKYLLNKLKGKNFIDIVSEKDIQVEEVYFTKVIELNIDFLKNIEMMLSTFSNDPEALFFIGIQLSERGKREEAIIIYEMTLKIDPKYVDAWNNKGATLGELGRREEALIAFEKALEIYPKGNYVWYNKGITLSDLERHEEALIAYNNALEIYPKYSHAWYNKGVTLRELERYEEAITAFDKALEIDPKYVDAWINKGVVLCWLERHEEALTAYDKALEIDIKNSNVWNNKGAALSQLERYEEALTAYDKVLKIDPKYVDAWINKGDTLGELKRHEEALTAFENALKIDPKYVDAWINKGDTLGELKRHEEALTAFENALKINPTHITSWYNKGVALYELERHEEALTAFDKVLKIDPEHVDAWYVLACVYSLMDKLDTSFDCLDRAIKIDDGYKKMAQEDSDFDNIRGNSRFKSLTS